MSIFCELRFTFLDNPGIQTTTKIKRFPFFLANVLKRSRCICICWFAAFVPHSFCEVQTTFCMLYVVYFVASITTMFVVIHGLRSPRLALHQGVKCSLIRCYSSRPSDEITSESNSKVKLLKSLNVKKKRMEHQLVLIEGHRMVIDAIDAGAQPRTVFFSDKGISSPLGNRLDLALRSIQNDCFVSKVPNSVVEAISDTVTCQGVVAAFQMPTPSISLEKALLDKRVGGDAPILVVLDNISDPGNLGTMIRSAYGLGASAVVVVNGCDIWSPKVLRSAMGLQLLSNAEMPVLEHSSWSELETFLSAHQQSAHGKGKSSGGIGDGSMQVVIADAHADNVSHFDIDFTQPTVLVVGSEAHGVSKEAYDMPCNVIQTRIPMARPLESFNAAVAGSVLLAEAARQRRSNSSAR